MATAVTGDDAGLTDQLMQLRKVLPSVMKYGAVLLNDKQWMVTLGAVQLLECR